ncbi:MAG: xanthine dehydrogenase accessory protein XdhC [Rubrivivax sp.]|nr:xanthine dehydrogenase accessory protein XdhC [Rubrivivax sp.]
MRATARAWRAAGRAAVVVQVLAHRGSVPRETGTRMLVAADAVAGTVGGGHLELQAIADARSLLERAAAGATVAPVAPVAPLRRQVALGPTLGQCCGGALDLGFTLLAQDDPQDWPAQAPRFVLQLYGAGHVGRAIVRLLAGLPCRVSWIDERESEFPREPLPPHVERLAVEPVQAEVAAAPPGAFFLVLTHSHELDLAITREVLARGDFGWFGLIGSHSKRARFEHRLRERGVADERIARMVCPIGVEGIAGKEPEVIAVAVVAQMLQAASARASDPGQTALQK